MLKPFYENIPQELKDVPHWVNWKAIERGGEETKPPFMPSGKFAKSDDPATWNTFNTVMAAADRFNGVGFVLTKDDPYVGIDFDKCYCPAFNLIDPTIEQYVRNLDSYTEVSPSGRGFRQILKGSLPVDGRKKGPVEVYQSGRYVTLTGHHIEGFPWTIENRQSELDRFYNAVFQDTTTEERKDHKERSSQLSTNGWKDRLQKTFQSKNGVAIKQLWDGDFSAYSSQSEADLALCSHLAYWLGGDAAAIDKAFRQSGLFREKWDEIHFGNCDTYGQRTINEALKGCHSFYGARSQGEREGVISPALSIAWPAPLDEAAYYGLAGEYVRMLDPHTEADPAAILYQFLVAFGNIVGRAPYFVVEADSHHTNEFLLLVGNTAKGRKGTSFGHIRKLFSEIDRDWTQERIKSGLISGEGLIYNVRDAMKDDEGVSDKRLVAFEPEFANVLKVIERRENTLSTTLRQSWDTGHLRTLAKNTPVKASDAHISLISHITKDELRRRMSEAEAFNGFANRFLFICVRRSKLLPEGGNILSLNFSRIIQGLKEAVKFSQTVGELKRDEEARAIWREVYGILTRETASLLGGVISRAEAHVLRLSMVYALLNCSEYIRKPHLMAALALWEYAEASAQYIFGSFTGDSIADKIYVAAQEGGGDGITRTFISQDLFQRHVKRERIDQAISSLVGMKKIRAEVTTTGGRPETKYYAT